MPSDPFIILNEKAEMTISLLLLLNIFVHKHKWPFHYFFFFLHDHFTITIIDFFFFCIFILIYYYLLSFFNWLHWCQAYDEKVINTNNSSLNLDILDNFLLAFFALDSFPYKLDCLYFCCNFFSELMSIFFIFFLFRYFVYEDLGHDKL